MRQSEVYPYPGEGRKSMSVTLGPILPVTIDHVP